MMASSQSGLSDKGTRGEASPKQVTYEALLKEMVDLNRLAEFPTHSYRHKMASSYDRRATDPFIMDETNWSSNDDFVETGKWDQLVAVEEINGVKEFVLMDEEGPGVIQRIWFAQGSNAGNIRFYLDGNLEPVIDMPVSEMFKSGAFPYLSPIANIRAEGYNNNLPIPFAKHCKVTVTRADDRYWYQITYRTYEPGVQIDSYTPEIAAAHEAQIRETARILAAPMSPALPAPVQSKAESRSLAPLERFSVAVEGENAAVYELRIRLDAENIAAALRGTLLEVEFDGTRTIQTPLGDFFGSAPGVNPFEALSLAVREDGLMISRWVMPFKKDVKLTIGNYSGADIKAEAELLTGDWDWTDQTMYFHAGWMNTGEINSFPRRDINFIELEGRGRYLGNMLHMANWNRDWWGEGDEKIWVDNESFPSVFGTGAEDYYGYAVCSIQLFSHPYHNQTRCEGPGNSGNTTLARFHLSDDIPYNTALRFDMGIWHWDVCTVQKAVTSWWYAFPGGKNCLPRLNTAIMKLPNLPAPEDRVGRNLFPNRENAESIGGQLQ